MKGGECEIEGGEHEINGFWGLWNGLDKLNGLDKMLILKMICL